MNDDVLSILKEVGAIITDDHFVYTSEKHGSVYINKDALYPHTQLVEKVGKLFAEKYKDESIDVVVAPALGGIVLSQWTAHALTKVSGREVLSLYTGKDEQENQVFGRGNDAFTKGKNALIIEDLTTTGGSVKKVIKAVEEAGGNIVAVGVMVNRSPDVVNAALFGYPFSSLGILFTEAFNVEDCPYCKENRPINTTVGHGKKFLEEKNSR